MQNKYADNIYSLMVIFWQVVVRLLYRAGAECNTKLPAGWSFLSTIFFSSFKCAGGVTLYLCRIKFSPHIFKSVLFGKRYSFYKIQG